MKEDKVSWDPTRLVGHRRNVGDRRLVVRRNDGELHLGVRRDVNECHLNTASLGARREVEELYLDREHWYPSGTR